TLIVPGENDKVSEMEEEAAWIASVENAAGKTIPLHVTRFFPRYHMLDKGATDIAQIHCLADTAKKYLNDVFVGNC
ncbi:MAG: radical SAM protein, partial [Lachnospiraceae bacterium]|nr:radical SAM protein [Lachnospiraceae bacterium]